MLISRRGDRLMLVTQTEHGRISGRLAEAWGNERFAIPAPREALLCAAAHHDDSWHELDGLPAYNDDARRPAGFVELPLERTVGPYSRGVESVYQRNPHAGVLVSMHLSGFYTGRWGMSDGGPVEHPLAAQVVAAQEARWMPALREAWGYRGPRSEFDADTWHAYEVLQALDVLSLALGLTDLARPSGDAEAVSATSVLGRLDQPGGPRLVGAVPVSAGGQRVELALRVTQPYRVRIDPYPFSEAELELTIAGRELEDRPYAGAEEAACAFHAAEVREQAITVVAGEDMNDERAALAAEVLRVSRDHDARQDDRMARYRNLEPETAALLGVLIRAQSARRVLELGTSNGYSTLWLGDAAEATGGHVLTVEIDPARTAQARANLERAGLEDVVECRTQGAGQALAEQPPDAWQFVFLDAERPQYPVFWPMLMDTLEPGGLLAIDNAISHGSELTEVRALIDGDDRVTSSLVPIGAGLLLAVLDR